MTHCCICHHVVYDKTTKRVLRHGYSKFDEDDNFNPTTEACVEKCFVFKPGLELQAWYYNEATQSFQTMPP